MCSTWTSAPDAASVARAQRLRALELAVQVCKSEADVLALAEKFRAFLADER